MHRLKMIYELKTTSCKQNKEPRDPFRLEQKLTPNPERFEPTAEPYRYILT